MIAMTAYNWEIISAQKIQKGEEVERKEWDLENLVMVERIIFHRLMMMLDLKDGNRGENH